MDELQNKLKELGKHGMIIIGCNEDVERNYQFFVTVMDKGIIDSDAGDDIRVVVDRMLWRLTVPIG